MYEHVRGILKHKHKLELDKKETYLPLLNSLNSTQRNIIKLNNKRVHSMKHSSTQHREVGLNSTIMYSTLFNIKQ